jgi:hypothetical protein
VQHPLLGSVDPDEGPSVLEERERELVHVPDAPKRYVEDEPVVELPAPEPVPERPSVRRLGRRIIAAGLRRLSRLADKLDPGE